MVQEVKVEGESEGDLLVLSWGSNVGKVAEAVARLRSEGAKVSHIAVELINPLQRGLLEAMALFERVVVCESNSGQLVSYLRSLAGDNDICSVADMGAQPFSVGALMSELKEMLN
jgi:2-oxoglutarate ferredoxin oxidoreductase subunit alpha